MPSVWLAMMRRCTRRSSKTSSHMMQSKSSALFTHTLFAFYYRTSFLAAMSKACGMPDGVIILSLALRRWTPVTLDDMGSLVPHLLHFNSSLLVRTIAFCFTNWWWRVCVCVALIALPWPVPSIKQCSFACAFRDTSLTGPPFSLIAVIICPRVS